jgi:oligoribonuclease
MTGLDPYHDALIEVAVIVTDSNLKPLGEGIDVLIKPSQEALDDMGDFVRNMHTSSGLLDELATGMTMEEAEAAVLDYVKGFVPEAGKAPLGGNTIGTDKGFLQVNMPALMDHLHYRMIDVSTIKELSRRWYPRAYFQKPKKAGGHRALADILESIDELRYYRETVFTSQPGPTSQQAKQAAKRIKETSVVATTGLSGV